MIWNWVFIYSSRNTQNKRKFLPVWGALSGVGSRESSWPVSCESVNKWTQKIKVEILTFNMRRHWLSPLWSPGAVAHHVRMTLSGQIFKILQNRNINPELWELRLGNSRLKLLICDVLGKVWMRREVKEFHSFICPVWLQTSASIAEFENKTKTKSWGWEIWWSSLSAYFIHCIEKLITPLARICL